MTQDPFVAQLADLCRSERTRAKWVFVPTHPMGLALGERLAREGCDWANLRFVTPLDVATRMAAPFLLERGIEPSEEPLGPSLVMRLLLDLLAEGGYFRPLADHPSMSEALWLTIRELRYAGLSAADLPVDAFESPAKHRELVTLLDAYEQHLAKANVFDMPMLLAEAMKHPEWCPIADGDLVTEIPEAMWAPLVRRFLDTLRGTRITARALALPGAAVPRRAAALAAPLERVDATAATDAGRLRFLQGPALAGAPLKDGSLDIFHAGGRDAEMDEVLRRIASSGHALDQVEIVCASAAYAMLAWEKASRLEWPVTVSAGVPATMTRPGRLLLRFCEWVGSDFGSAELRRLLQSGDCAPAAFRAEADETTSLSSGQAARLLLKAEVTSGRARYAPALARLIDVYGKEAAYAESSDEQNAWNRKKALQVGLLKSWVSDVIASVPEPDAAKEVSLDALAEAAVGFLQNNASRASAMDSRAFVVLTDALKDLTALGTHRCSLETALGLIRGRVEMVSVGRDRARPGQLHVSSLADGGYDGRPITFVVGLQEGGVFPAAIEDPVLLDAERERIHPALRTSSDRLSEIVFAAVGRLAAIGASSDRVCLSFSCRDTREFRETFPSWMVLQAYRLKAGDASLSYDQMAKWLGEPASAVPRTPEQALTDAGWWLTGAVSQPAARTAIFRAFPSLKRGLDAEAARDTDVFTEFDGHVPDAGVALDPSRNPRGISATTLESAAACPFRFFLQQGLGVKPIEEGNADDEAWLDPRTRGSELHALYAAIMRQVRDDGRAPHLKKDTATLRKMGEARLKELREEMPPPSDEVYEHERAEFLEDLDAFIAAECEGQHGTSPVGFEVGFGLPPERGSGEPLESPDPLVLDLGGKRRLILHGRIDRINKLAEAEYEVADYKTGGFFGPAWKGKFAGGTRLQHAIYGRAAEKLLRAVDKKARVVKGTYLFPAVKGHARWKTIEAPPKGLLERVLGNIVDVVSAGAFIPAGDKEACKFCDCGAACRAWVDPDTPDAEPIPAAEKRANEANTALAAVREMKSHE